MSEELEQAIKVIGNTRLHTYDGIGNIQSKPISESHEFKVIVKALTPPTADEVCEAIQKDCKIEKVLYVNGRFYDEDDGETIVSYFDYKRKPNIILNGYIFTLETLIKICRFYEGLEAHK